MGMFDKLVEGLPAFLGGKQQGIVSAAASLLSQKEGSVGGTGGLGSIVSAFQQKGLGDIIKSWISPGPNLPVSPTQVQEALGPDVINNYAEKAGVAPEQASSALAEVLPSLVDHLTPDGKMPEPTTLEDRIGSLFGAPSK